MLSAGERYQPTGQLLELEANVDVARDEAVGAEVNVDTDVKVDALLLVATEDDVAADEDVGTLEAVADEVGMYSISQM